MGCDAAERTSKTNATGLQIERGSGAKDQFVGQCARLRISLIIDVRGIGSIVRGVIFDVRMFSSRAELGNSVGERSGKFAVNKTSFSTDITTTQLILLERHFPSSLPKDPLHG